MTGILTGKRVLLVEDEILISMLAEEILQDLGAHIVGPAARLEHAWALLDTEAIDLAMLDRNLNGEFSDELAAELRRRGIPVVLATGYGAMSGADDIIVVAKPYSDEMIAEAFERAMVT